MKTVNQSMRKKDAMQLVTGQPVYMDDVSFHICFLEMISCIVQSG